MSNKIKWIFLVLTSVAIAGCIIFGNTQEEKYYKLATSLTQLSTAVDTVVSFGDLTENATEKEVIDEAVRRDPSMLVPFADYSLHVVRRGSLSAVLVCTKDEQRALLEDTAYTVKFDKHYWRDSPAAPCKSTIDFAHIQTE
ncbi:MAG: hypothetical protein JW915_10505 [Chitinispirillaceae bacterium]|nr:hypothetical protein [Chitinispirillaceae bacterium]